MLGLYKRLIALRRGSDALRLGDYVPQSAEDGVLAFERHAAGERLAIVLNLTQEPVRYALPEDAAWTVVISTTGGDPAVRGGAHLDLGPDEGLILRAS